MIMSGTQLLRTGVFYIVEMFECFEMIFLLMCSVSSQTSVWLVKVGARRWWEVEQRGGDVS